MGQYKPMSKMKTTEPSVELKLKKGGRVKMAEGGKSDMAQDKAMIKKAMKQHDAQEHKGGKGTTLKLKKGGTAPKAGPDEIGGLAGGIEATRPVMKRGTGKIEGPGYKKGGLAKKFLNNMSGAKQTKSFHTKTGGLEGKGYKDGGAASYLDKMVDGSKMPVVKGKTKSIKQEPAGYKHGGHVAMKSGGMAGYKSGGKMCKY